MLEIDIDCPLKYISWFVWFWPPKKENNNLQKTFFLTPEIIWIHNFFGLKIWKEVGSYSNRSPKLNCKL